MNLEFSDVERAAAKPLLTVALREDLSRLGDITSNAFLSPEQRSCARIVARRNGVVCGLHLASAVFELLDPQIEFQLLSHDGQSVKAGEILAEVRGRTITLLAGERPALNFLGHLSGIATLTNQFVDSIRSTKSSIYDTRKTIPGWRILAKYAVRCGGGRNHRMGLFDQILIKDNHIAAWREASPENDLPSAVARARSRSPEGTLIEIEVDSLKQLREVLPAHPNIILLDNFTIPMLNEGVEIRNAHAADVELEASGGITLSNIQEVAKTGVERISVGALTHSAPAFDVAMDWT